ncbi:MAG TPA: S8 family serine peptidase [Candidatus Thermoplasmatota archaeon]|nr:S8 family serine peptidase [Candidatus Thermoplasmatota archaeon]
MRKRSLAALAALLLLAPLAGGAAPSGAAPTRGTPSMSGLAPAPPSDLGAWWLHSALDADGSGVHDALERLSLGEFPTVIVVDYAVAPGDGDRGNLERLGLEVGLVLPSLLAITATARSPAQVRAAEALPETVMIESGGRPFLALDAANPAQKARESDEYSPNTAWNLGYSGAGVVIAVMDTGADNEHPGLQGKWLGGVDVSKPQTRLTPRDGTFDADDTQGHGTSVSCMALGTGDPDGTYAGIARASGLVDLRIGTIFGAAPGEGPLNVYDGTLQGIDWAIQFKDHAWPGGSPGIDVLSLSWGNNVGGSSDGSDVYSRGIDKLVQAGIIAVIAAGNAGPSNDGFDGLGASSFAITVAATDDINTIDREDDIIASYSSRGPRADNDDGYAFDELKPEIAAPGTDITSCQYDPVGDGSGNGYQGRGSGTSYATPMVAGVVALMLEANGDLAGNWRLVKEILTHTAERRGNATSPEVDPFWNKDFGYGIVDAFKAVSLARDLKGVTDTIDPELQAVITNTSARSAVRESFGVQGLSFAKRGTVEYVEIQVDGGPWTRIAAPMDGNQTPFAYAVDVRGFADGNHTVRVRASAQGILSLTDEVTFNVAGALPRPGPLLTSGVAFLIGAAAISAGVVYYVRRVKLRPVAPQEPPRESF